MCCRTACHIAERRRACTHLDLSELHRLPGPVVICFWSIHCSAFASMSLWPQATPRLGLVQLMLLELTLTSGGGATTFSSTGSPPSEKASRLNRQACEVCDRGLRPFCSFLDRCLVSRASVELTPPCGRSEQLSRAQGSLALRVRRQRVA